MRLYSSWTSALLALALMLRPGGVVGQVSNGPAEIQHETLMSGAALQPYSEAPQARAIRTTMGINVNGRPDEAVWLQAPAITEFTQNDPYEGQPISERTTRPAWTSSTSGQIGAGASVARSRPPSYREAKTRCSSRSGPLRGISSGPTPTT